MATLVEDKFDPETWVLSIDGAEQSHVDPVNPTSIRYEYLQRIHSAILSEFDREARLRCLHLGAGALTLLRALQVQYPRSFHAVVDIEPDLVASVVQELPLPDRSRFAYTTADAAAFAAELREVRKAEFPDSYEAIVIDIFHGADTAPQLQVPAFYEDVRALLSAQGLMIVNVGDESDQSFSRRLMATISKSFDHVLVAAHPDVLHRKMSGNTIIVGSEHALDPDFVHDFRRRGPFPAEVLTLQDLNGYSSGNSAK